MKRAFIKKLAVLVVGIFCLCGLTACTASDNAVSTGSAVSETDFEEGLLAGDISLVESSAVIEDYSEWDMGMQVQFKFVVQNNSNHPLKTVGVHALILDDEENILGTADGWVDADIASGKKATVSGSFIYDDYPGAVSLRADSGLYDSNGDYTVFEIDFLEEEILRTQIDLAGLIPEGSENVE